MLNRILVLDNPVQDYEWGSRTAIAELLGRPVPAPGPQAELWMGAHPKAPSRVVMDGASISLIDIIQHQPQTVLGEAVVRKFGPRLPFLFKVLAAAQPLSIQAHPDSARAREGFARENRLGIPLDDPRRNYRDERHKPECLCALTPFRAMCGFREIPEMLELLSRVWPEDLSTALSALRRRPDPSGLRAFFGTLLNTPPDLKGRILNSAVRYARRFPEESRAFYWVNTLNDAYPGDIGALSPLMLNLIDLQPGEAIFLPAGQLHAYLEGVGVELMANSDNVLRGGLTPKHVDVGELLGVLDFRPRPSAKLAPERVRSGESIYPVPAEEFSLSVIETVAGSDYLSPVGRSVELLICLRGEAVICNLENVERIEMPRGCSVLVPAAVDRFRITGDALVYKAFVPDPKNT